MAESKGSYKYFDISHYYIFGAKMDCRIVYVDANLKMSATLETRLLNIHKSINKIFEIDIFVLVPASLSKLFTHGIENKV